MWTRKIPFSGIRWYKDVSLAWHSHHRIRLGQLTSSQDKADFNQIPEHLRWLACSEAETISKGKEPVKLSDTLSRAHRAAVTWQGCRQPLSLPKVTARQNYQIFRKTCARRQLKESRSGAHPTASSALCTSSIASICWKKDSTWVPCWYPTCYNI